MADVLRVVEATPLDRLAALVARDNPGMAPEIAREQAGYAFTALAALCGLHEPEDAPPPQVDAQAR